jgi:3'-phosphoadenosine 5'-phosphosulfate sulfotransferase (PAPS reductase)/FAD synthetase
MPTTPDLASYDRILVNSSAGKDSQAMLTYLVRLCGEQGIPLDRIVVVHCDLGRVEWMGTAELAAEQAAAYGLRFEVVNRELGDLLDQVLQRRANLDAKAEAAEALAETFRAAGQHAEAAAAAAEAQRRRDTPAWPSSTARWCTSDQKTSQVVKLITRLTEELPDLGRPVRILNCLGLRADESPARAKKPAFGPDSASNGKRTVDRWLPIFDWTTEQVWDVIKASGLRHHWAYDLGMPRLSCILCLDGTTEVVTRDGIKPIAALADGHHELLVPKVTAFGLSSEAGFARVPVMRLGQQPLLQVALVRGRQRKVVRATPEHRWFLRTRRLKRKANGRHGGYDPITVERVTAELQPGDRLRSVRAVQPPSTGRVPFAIAQGFVFGDGARGQGERPATLTIYDAEKDGALLPYFAGHDVRPVTTNGGPAQRIYGLPRTWKDIPTLRESRSFLLSWLAGYFAADGTVTADGSARLASASREHLEFVRSVAAICGVGYGPIMTSSRLGKGVAPSDLHTISLDASSVPKWFFLIDAHRDRVGARLATRQQDERLWCVESVTEVPGECEVYCAVVPGAQSFALSDELMTGNCVLAGKRELILAARHNPALAAEYAAVEVRVGHTFRADLSMAEIVRLASLPEEPAEEPAATPLQLCMEF